METKYLTDGRKVSVIGKVNSQEYIVREIFISDGKEIESGENFITKTLLDTPIKSYLAIENERYKNQITQSKTLLDSYYDKMKSKEEELKRIAEVIKRSNFIKDKIADFDWDYFVDILTDQMKYAVSTNYGIHICSANSELSYFEGLKFDDLKAIIIKKIYNKEKNQYEYVFDVNRYRTGSGSSVEFKFFKNKIDLENYLLPIIQEKVSKKQITLKDVSNIEKYINVPKEIKETLIQNHNDSCIKRHKDFLENAEKELKNMISI